MTVRVMHFCEEWLPQTQPWIFNQIRFLPPQVENHIVCQRVRNLDQFPSPRIHSLGDAPRIHQFFDRGVRFLGIRRHLGFLRAGIRRIEPQILHSHFGHVGWANLGAVSGLPPRHVVTFYGQDLSRLPKTDPRWLSRYGELFEKGDLFLCEGPHMAKTLAGLGCPEAKIEIQRLGIDLSKIEFRPRRWSPSEPLRVLIASSFVEKKGIPYAIRALRELRHSHALEVTVIGDSNRQPGSQEEKERILGEVESSGLKPAVQFLGYRPHTEFLMEAYRHHLFLAPSVTAAHGDTEGGAPVSIIEMAASGMPVVSSRHCDIPGVVLDGVNASLADERDVSGLVQGMEALIEVHEEWPSRLREGRRHIERYFDAGAQGPALAQRYDDLLSRTEHGVRGNR